MLPFLRARERSSNKKHRLGPSKAYPSYSVRWEHLFYLIRLGPSQQGAIEGLTARLYEHQKVGWYEDGRGMEVRLCVGIAGYVL